MPGSNFAFIVASLHGRSGKTLLARLLADYLILSGPRPLIFDSDAVERTLCSCFPYEAIVVDLADVRGQMVLFDTLAKPFAEMRVVDVAHHSFRKFFDLMRDTDFVEEAKYNDIEPVIFYLVGSTPESFEEGRQLRERFSDCRFVVVENAHFSTVNDSVRRSSGFRALARHELHMVMPSFNPIFADVISNPTLSLSEVLSQPMSLSDGTPATVGLSLDARTTLRGWLVRMFQEIHRITSLLDEPADTVVGDWD